MTTLLALLLLSAAAPPAPAQETWTVKAGDSCDAIARAVWGDRKHIAELHKWNELGPPPHHLPPTCPSPTRPSRAATSC